MIEKAAGGLPLESAKIVPALIATLVAGSDAPRERTGSGEQGPQSDVRVDPAFVDHLAGDIDDDE